MKEIFRDKLELEYDIIIGRAHTAKKNKYGKKDQPRPLGFNLLNYSYKEKVKVLQNCRKLKGSQIYIKEDFCQPTLHAQVRNSRRGGGLCIFIHESLCYNLRKYLSFNSEAIESLPIEISIKKLVA